MVTSETNRYDMGCLKIYFYLPIIRLPICILTVIIFVIRFRRLDRQQNDCGGRREGEKCIIKIRTLRVKLIENFCYDSVRQNNIENELTKCQLLAWEMLIELKIWPQFHKRQLWILSYQSNNNTFFTHYFSSAPQNDRMRRLNSKTSDLMNAQRGYDLEFTCPRQKSIKKLK